MNRKIMSAVGVAAAASLALTGCGGESEPEAAEGPVTITLAGWDFASTPEFQTLADAYHEANPDVTVELKEYPAAKSTTRPSPPTWPRTRLRTSSS